ncbi:Rv3212 family protein [Umezawaea beigongshangensis]|uniref:Rv3212 family protein n=1 Tax=Umezawaea beigongshangensis TaxID=2780383 RepID=UPI0027DB8C3D|nr:PQQ-binding-like beta-propeller repeat protein [Umezawaea beigongshangensis]
MGRPEQPHDTDELPESEHLAPDPQAHRESRGVPPEDVLGDDEPAPVPDGPRPRTWRTGRDYAALAVIVVGVLVGGLLVWRFGDARATTSITGPSSVPQLPSAVALPPSLGEVWRAPSGATHVPITLDSTAVTGEGGQVAGRDPLTGDVRWSYTRDWPLCTVSAAWGKVVAVHRKETNCSEVTTLDPASGTRGPQRNGDAELGTVLLSEGSHLVTTGERYVDVYRRDDLVRSLEYGTLRAPVNSGKQPRTNCSYGSFAVATGKIALVERCPEQDPGDRLTVLKPNPEKSDEPQVLSSTVLGGTGARVVAVTTDRVAVALPGPSRLVVLDANSGAVLDERPLDVPDGDLSGDPEGRTAPTWTSSSHVFWYTGSRTTALALDTLSPVWTAEDTLGPGTVLAGRLLLPVPEGFRVLDQATGQQIGVVALDRGGHEGPVRLTAVGPVVLEQRGGTLVALR